MRRHYFFYGRVQGVGFRWKAYHAANMYGVTGFARNLHDGSVEMEAEGSEEAIDMVIAALNNDGWIRVDRIEAENIPEVGDRGFRTE